MTLSDLQSHCEHGQQLLTEMKYLEAERVLAAAERDAWHARDYDTLARLYMPLQEARRQRRQRCGEGVVCLDLIPQGPDDRIEARHVLDNYPQGQLLLAGWGSIEPAANLRKLAARHDLYVETFLAAAYPLTAGIAVVIVPLERTPLPPPEPRSFEALQSLLPPNCIAFKETEVPTGSRRGDAQTYGQIMALWERLHQPFLADAQSRPEDVEKLDGYRKTIRVDYACELAHQEFSTLAHHLARTTPR